MAEPKSGKMADIPTSYAGKNAELLVMGQLDGGDYGMSSTPPGSSKAKKK